MLSKKICNQVIIQNLYHNIKQLKSTTGSYKNSKIKPCFYINTFWYTPTNPFLHLFASSNNIDKIVDLIDKANEVLIVHNNKVAKLNILYTRWIYKDTKKKALVKKALQAYQRNR